ncbi:hypothetical protein ACSNOI_36575, partial [Actinomadura kijaniata]
PAPAREPVEAPEPVRVPLTKATEPAASPVPALTAPYAALGGTPAPEGGTPEGGAVTRRDNPVQDDGATQALPAVAGDPADAQATAMFDAPPPDLIPGLDPVEPGRREGTALTLPKLRRGTHNHVLGVALSLTIGVLVGVAIIALVLWPQLREDDPNGPGPSNGSDAQAVRTIPEAFGGTWKGTATNTASGVTFPVEVTFEAGGTTARAVYPKEGCNGTLTLARGTGSSLQMTLDIAKPCSAGNIRVTRNGDGSLRYEWSKPGSARGYAATLRKT